VTDFQNNKPLTSPQEFIVHHWNEGKTVQWIASRIEHRYDKPLERVIADYVTFLAGCQEELPGSPRMRPLEEKPGWVKQTAWDALDESRGE
jgi:hypothetical protein